MTKTNEQSLKIIIPISFGELIDKITILQIKKERIGDNKLAHVEKELGLLENILSKNNFNFKDILFMKLKDINTDLWKIEDAIRNKEIKKQFDEEFINLARSIYIKNDKRSVIKREINLKYNSDIIEEKSYNNY